MCGALHGDGIVHWPGMWLAKHFWCLLRMVMKISELMDQEGLWKQRVEEKGPIKNVSKSYRSLAKIGSLEEKNRDLSFVPSLLIWEDQTPINACPLA